MHRPLTLRRDVVEMKFISAKFSSRIVILLVGLICVLSLGLGFFYWNFAVVRQGFEEGFPIQGTYVGADRVIDGDNASPSLRAAFVYPYGESNRGLWQLADFGVDSIDAGFLVPTVNPSEFTLLDQNGATVGRVAVVWAIGDGGMAYMSYRGDAIPLQKETQNVLRSCNGGSGVETYRPNEMTRILENDWFSDAWADLETAE